jgi:glycosyltransferase involved in cell wall biosynthesis
MSVPTVSVIVPAMNEETNLPHVLPGIPDWVHEVILVDGRSTDRTIEVATALRDDVVIVKQKGAGKGDALIAGFNAATGDIIVTVDADGSMAGIEIHAYVGALMAGADYVKGSRFMQGGGTSDMEFVRMAGNLALVNLTRLAFGGRYTDLCYGYNAFWRECLDELRPDADGFEIETQLNVRALKANLRIVEVPSFEARRVNGTSNLRTWPDGWRVLVTIITERLRRHENIVVDLRVENEPVVSFGSRRGSRLRSMRKKK